MGYRYPIPATHIPAYMYIHIGRTGVTGIPYLLHTYLHMYIHIGRTGVTGIPYSYTHTLHICTYT